MKVFKQDHYIDRLCEIYPDIARESIKKVLSIGNSALIKGIKKNIHSSYQLSGKDRVLDKSSRLFIFKFHTLYYNNKHKFKKRLKDARDRK